ncbi:MAG TPA: ribonuclease P [Candidatus Bathyarchaeia archaeon]
MNTTTKQIAENRIRILFEQADKVYETDPNLSGRYVEMARKIAMSAKVRLPLKYRRRICKKCNSLLVHGSNCRVRLRQRREPHVVVTCLNCGHQTRYLLRKKKEKNET